MGHLILSAALFKLVMALMIIHTANFALWEISPMDLQSTVLQTLYIINSILAFYVPARSFVKLIINRTKGIGLSSCLHSNIGIIRTFLHVIFRNTGKLAIFNGYVWFLNYIAAEITYHGVSKHTSVVNWQLWWYILSRYL